MIKVVSTTSLVQNKYPYPVLLQTETHACETEMTDTAAARTDIVSHGEEPDFDVCQTQATEPDFDVCQIQTADPNFDMCSTQAADPNFGMCSTQAADPYAKYKAMEEQLKRFKEDNASSKLSKYMVKTKKNYTVSSIYARMASAGSKSQINAVMSEARRDISTLRMAASYGTAKERSRARAALSSLNKLLLRGKRKIRRLDEEKLTELRRKRAETNRKKEQLKLEMQKRRNNRALADRAIMLEGHLADMNNAVRFRDWDDGNEDWGSASYSPYSESVPAAEPSDSTFVENI